MTKQPSEIINLRHIVAVHDLFYKSLHGSIEEWFQDVSGILKIPTTENHISRLCSRPGEMSFFARQPVVEFLGDQLSY